MNYRLTSALTLLIIFISLMTCFADQAICVLPYTADKDSAAFASELTALVSKEISAEMLTPDTEASALKIPSDDKDQESIDAVVNAAKKAKTDLIMTGQITATDEYYQTETIIISSDEKKIVYRSFLPV